MPAPSSVTAYSIGLHNYEPNNAPTNAYTTGEIADYLALLGLATGGGAIAHAKLKDQAGFWAGGLLPSSWGTGNHNSLFMTEAKAAGFTTVGQWMFSGATVPWDYVDDAAKMAAFDTAAALLVSTYPDVDAWLFGNEREADGIGNGIADDDARAAWFSLENRAGQIWQGLGKGWAAGADQAVSNFLSALDERQAAYDTDPDYWVVHGYGNGGLSARHIRDVRLALEHKTGATWSDRVIWGEIAIDFENLTGFDTKDWVRDYRARDWWEHIGRALRRERCFGCYFNLKEVMRPWDGITTEDTTKYVVEGMLDSFENTAQNANPPARLPVTAGAITRRYLIEGPLERNAVGAALQAAKEFARSYPEYFTYWSDQ